jgi:hypothetical protein
VRFVRLAMFGLIALGASNARAGLTTVDFASDYSQHHLAQFDGLATYNSDTGKLTVAVTNTTTAVKGGFVTGIALAAGGPTADLVDDSSAFVDARNRKGIVKAGSLGRFHAGATTGADFSSGKRATEGIAAGSSRVFTFQTTVSNASSLTVADFLTPGKTGEEIVARFKKLEHHHADRAGAVEIGPVSTLLASQFDPISETGLLPLDSAPAAGPAIGGAVSAIPLPPAFYTAAFTLVLIGLTRIRLRRIQI